MLHSKFSRVAFASHLLLFSAMPAIGFQHSNTPVIARGDADTVDASSATANKILLNKNAVKFVRNYIQKNNEDLKKIKQRSRPAFKIMDIVFNVSR